MTGHTTLTVGLAGTVAAAAAGGPLTEVFNELGLTMALMGALGGIAIGIPNNRPWRGIMRSGFLGGLLAFGFGVVSPHIVGAVFKVDPSSGSVSAMAAVAFLIGFGQRAIVEWVQKERGNAK